ncbi:MAG: hypothetical protein WC731_05870 [Candidatus Omnitrophota bacterium]|jgi:hypothetical protein
MRQKKYLVKDLDKKLKALDRPLLRLIIKVFMRVYKDLQELPYYQDFLKGMSYEGHLLFAEGCVKVDEYLKRKDCRARQLLQIRDFVTKGIKEGMEGFKFEITPSDVDCLWKKFISLHAGVEMLRCTLKKER